jgi:putative phosphoribosyl transferase
MEAGMSVITRVEAGRNLAMELGRCVSGPVAVVAVSRSGAAVANEVADALKAPLDMLCARRLDVPGRPHSTFGAVAHGIVRLDRDAIARLHLPAAYVERMAELASADAEQLTRTSRGIEAPVVVGGCAAVLVDDGFAEPVLLEAAVAALRAAGPISLTLATPVWTAATRSRLRPLVDQAVVLCQPEDVDQALVCDGAFVQTTAPELQTMIARSRRRSSVTA